MKFSVIIPAYQAKQTLSRSLLSVQNQTFSDFEVIIVDDGSTDDTAKIAKEFTNRDTRFRYIYQDNQGVSAARNRGLMEAKGEYIVFLDSDDQYDREYLQEFNHMIANYPNFDHFWCGYNVVDTQGKQIGQSRWLENNQIQILDRTNIMDFHEKGLDAALWNKAFRKDSLEQAAIKMDETMSLGEDLLFNFAYLDVCRTEIVMSSLPLYVYTKANNGSLDSKYRSNLKEVYEIINDQMLVYLKKWNISTAQMKKYYSSAFFSFERVLYNTYRSECLMTSAQKRKFNNMLIRSEKFQTALKMADCKVNPLYHRAYELGSWRLIMLLDCLVKIKAKLLRK